MPLVMLKWYLRRNQRIEVQAKYTEGLAEWRSILVQVINISKSII